jgi:putative ABC transport system substrate-binding protein
MMSSCPTGRRILGFGKHPEIAAALQEKLHSLGFQATTFALTNDELGKAGLIVDRILKGASPGSLPIEQPTKYDLVVNLKTAKALSLTLPPSLLLRATSIE